MKKNCTGFFIKIHPPTEEGENLGGSKSAYKNNELNLVHNIINPKNQHLY